MKILNKNFRSAKMTVESMIDACYCQICECQTYCNNTSSPSSSSSTSSAASNGISMGSR